jgi:hypothetical protein
MMHSNLDPPPHSFEEAIEKLINISLIEIDRQAKTWQLYYHNSSHAQAVKQRANIIFNALLPWLEETTDRDNLKRMQYLMDLCAIAHDLVQIFITDTQCHTARRRENGLSEAATIAKLIDYIDEINGRFILENPQKLELFNEGDKNIIKETIEATICVYDTEDQSIYQPDLYQPEKNLSFVARIVALADLGSLGMEGIQIYHQEGRFILLEENPDILAKILGQYCNQSPLKYKEKSDYFNEQLRLRLLDRARFQVTFARGRFNRFIQEVQGLPAPAIPTLKTQVFKYLTPETIETIEAMTPTADDTTLEDLIQFFRLREV